MTTDEELNLLDQQLRRLKIEYEIYFNNPQKRPPADIEWKVLSILRKFSDGARISFSQRFRYNEMAQRYAVQSDLWRKKARIREEGYRRPADALLGVQGVRTFEENAADDPQARSASEHEIHESEVIEVGSDSLEAATSAALSAVAQAAPWPVAPQEAAKAGMVKPASVAVAPPASQPVAKAAAVKAAPARKAPYSAQLRDVEKDQKSVESLFDALVEAKKNAGEKLGDAANFDAFSSFVKKKTDQIRKQYACETVEYSVEVEAGKVKLKAKAAPRS